MTTLKTNTQGLRALKILIAGAPASLARDLERELKRAGLSIESHRVSTQRTLLPALREFAPHLILTAFRFTEGDGVSIPDLLKAHAPAIPFIVVTTPLGDEAAISSMQAGASDYILSDRLDRFAPAVRAVLDRIERGPGHAQSERAPVGSAEVYRTLFEESIEAHFISSPDGVLRDINRAGIELLGLPSKEAVRAPGVRRESFMGMVDLEAYRRAMRRQGFVKDFEFQLRRPDWSTLTVQETTTAVRDDSGNIIAFQGIIRDVTERKRMEEQLRRSEESYRTLAEASRDMIFIIDREDTIQYVNSYAAQMLGKRSDEIIGKNREEFFPGDVAHRQKGSLRRALESGESLWVENWIRFPGGDMWLDTSLVPLRDEQGEITSVLGVSRDITQRKRAEMALEESEERYRQLVEHSPDAIVVYQNGRVVFANSATLRLIGAERMEDILGRPVLEVVHPVSRETAEQRMRLLESGADEVPVTELTVARMDGHTIQVETAAMSLSYNGKRAVQMVVRDITQRKQAEERLRLSDEILNRVGTLVLVADRNGLITYASPSTKWVLGYEPEELLGEGWWKMSREDPGEAERERSNVVMLQAGEVPFSRKPYERVVRGKNGEAHWILWQDTQTPNGLLIGVGHDITERKQAEEALRTSEAKYRQLVEQIPAVTYIAPLDSLGMHYVSPQFEKMLGPSQEQPWAEGDQWLNQIHPEDRERVVREMHRCRVNGEPLLSEYRISGSDGEVLWVRDEAVIVRDDHGNPLFVQGLLFDITERKHAEEAVGESEAKYRTLVEQAADGIFIADADWNLILVNPKACEMLGYTEEELHRMNILDTYVPEDLGTALRRREDAPVRRTSQFERRMRRKDGSTFPVEVNLRRLEDGTYQGIVRDVSERKKAEESLQKLMRAVEQTDEVIFMTEVDGTITYVNPAFEKVYGYSREEAIGKTPRILKSGTVSPEFYRQLWRNLLDGKGLRGEYTNRAKDGSLVNVEASVNPVFAGGAIVGFIAVQKDITERKQAETERRNLEAQVFRMQKMESIGTLAGGIAHDFNNLLGIILGHSTLIEQLPSDAVRAGRSAQAITRTVQRGASLVRQILTFARKADVSFEPLNMNDSITELVRMLEETFPKTISFTLNLERDLPLIDADRSQVHQTLLNLCVNARDAMPDGGKLTLATARITGEKIRRHFPDASGGDFVHVSVTDSGAGMSQNTMRRIFEPFFTTKEPGKGTGLGLAVAYGIVKSHHGFIDVESTQGRGTSFHLYLPVPARLHEAARGEEIVQAEIPGGQETLLFVEDEQMLRELVQSLLETKGYRVLVASDGEEALTLYDHHRTEIKLVITDIGLPRMSGTDVFRKLRLVAPDARVIFASGYLEPQERRSLLEAGASGFVDKPYVPQDMLLKIREILDRKI